MSPTSLVVQRRRFAVAAPTAVVLGLTIALLLSDVFSRPVREAASSVGLLVAGVVGALSCAVRARQTRGRRRRSWRLIFAAGVVAVLGNLWVAAVGADPVSSPSAVGELSIAVALLLAIAALLNFPSARRRGIDLLVMALDGIVAAGAVLIIASVLVYAQLLEAASHDSAGTVALVFPALDVALATVAVLLVLRASGTDRPVLSLVAAGFIMYAVGDLAFAVLAEQDRFHFGTPVDLGWIAGYLTIGLAAWVPSDLVDELPERAQSGPSDTRGAVMVFGVLLMAVLVQVVFGAGGRFHGAEAVTWLVLIFAVGARQTLLAADNAALRRGLQRRVREQTSDLRRLARQTEVLLTSVGDGIYGVDHEGRVTFVNPSGAAALGYRADDLLGRQAHESFHAPDVDGLPFPWRGCYVAEAIRSGDVAIGEEDLYVRADGETFPVEITASPVVEDDELRGAVVVFRDVTQRREVDRMKNEFLSVVSHELRTPLTAIRGSLGLLAGGKLGELTPRAEAMVTMALRSTERLTRLINDLLDIERIESGTRPLELAALDARQLVAGAVRQLEGLAAAEGVRLEVGPCNGRVLADEDRIMQTLTNLLGNAVKFSERGDVVVADAWPTDGHVLFRVRDEGRGIPADKLESIFTRFEQVDSSDARQKGGTGLGLAISRTIVERLGGRIWAESELGVGTTLQFTLPTAPGREGGAPGRPDAGPVLVVADDEAASDVLVSLLQDRGLRVARADVADAAGLARDLEPRVVVLDVPHLETEGADALSQLRRQGGTVAGAGLVVLLPPGSPGNGHGDLRLGETLYLTKGQFDLQELGDRVLALVLDPIPTPEGTLT
jgi:PAS domain S-box-containing protein